MSRLFGSSSLQPRAAGVFSATNALCAQTLYIVRHGESEYNAAVNLTRDFRDPQIFDPQLTAKGRAQARPASLTSSHLHMTATAFVAWRLAPLHTQYPFSLSSMRTSSACECSGHGRQCHSVENSHCALFREEAELQVAKLNAPSVGGRAWLPAPAGCRCR